MFFEAVTSPISGGCSCVSEEAEMRDTFYFLAGLLFGAGGVFIIAWLDTRELEHRLAEMCDMNLSLVRRLEGREVEG